MLLRFAALLVLATSLFLVQRAASPIFEQNRKVATWPSVDATVTAKLVDPPAPRSSGANVRERAGELIVPSEIRVEYSHQVGGSIFRRLRTTPRTEEYAFAGPELFTAKQVSQTRRGYYDPANPGELFLPKPLGIADYWPILFWGPLLGLGFGGLVLRKPGYSARSPADRMGKGWYRLRPKYSIRQRGSGSVGVALVTTFISGLAAYDYFTGEPRARTIAGNAIVFLAMLPAAATLSLAAYYLWLARRVGDARVAVNAARVMPGTRLAVKVELPLKAGVDLEHVVASLACVRSEFGGFRGRFRERVIWEERADRDVGSRRAPAGGRVSFEQRFTVPPDAQPSFRGGLAGPWIDWEIRVEFHLDDGPDYRGKFPVTVELERTVERGT